MLLESWLVYGRMSTYVYRKRAIAESPMVHVSDVALIFKKK